ncbi:MAG TPA: lytic transglycosylase domain-containing protein [Longimicrobiales bacterium]|nr:lytic transglycosylase domain-containing protein [Longimicrobiales bacterium]
MEERKPTVEFLRRFRRPILGLGILGTALPLVRAGSPADTRGPGTNRAREAEDAAKTAGDAEDQVAARIGAAHADAERDRQVDGAIARYGIDRTLAESIHDVAREEGISPPVAFGLVNTESTFRERAVSSAGARGLTQVLPNTAKSVVPEAVGARIFERDTNLRAGFRYLRQLMDKYSGDLRLALLAYNRGPGNVDRILDRGGNPDNGYADRVLRG